MTQHIRSACCARFRVLLTAGSMTRGWAVRTEILIEEASVPYDTLWITFKWITTECYSDEKKMLFMGTARGVYRLD